MSKRINRVVFKDHPKSKVFLSPIEMSDVDRYYAWTNDHDVTRFLMIRFPTTRKQEETWCAGSAASAQPENIVLAIIEKKGGTHIGSIGLHRISWGNRSATTGAMIGDKRFWGAGYGSHAKLLLLKYAFDELGLHSIESRVAAFNGRSAAYNKKCGYLEVGRMPERTFRDGKFHDEIVMETRPTLFRPIWKSFEAGTFGTSKRKK